MPPKPKLTPAQSLHLAQLRQQFVADALMLSDDDSPEFLLEAELTANNLVKNLRKIMMSSSKKLNTGQ